MLEAAFYEFSPQHCSVKISTMKAFYTEHIYTHHVGIIIYIYYTCFVTYLSTP